MVNKLRKNLIFKRVVAYWVDSLLIFVVYVISQTMLLVSGVQNILDLDNHLYLYTLFTISIPFYLVISIIEYLNNGVSPGKMVMKIKVDLQKKSKLYYFLRNLPKFFVWECFHLALGLELLEFIYLGYGLILVNIWLLWKSKGNQALHDWMIGTKVK